MTNKKQLSLVAIAGITASLALGAPVFAQEGTGAAQKQWMMGGRNGEKGGVRTPGVFGSVSAVSGNSITVVTKSGPNGIAGGVTYTVDATNATIMKNKVASNISGVLVGDTVMVQGQITGTNIAAKNIRDGVMMGEGGGGDRMGQGIWGTVSSLNGTTLVVSGQTGRPNPEVSTNNAGGTNYTVDASNANFEKNGAQSSISGIAVGDTVMIQGQVTGTNVIAKNVRDGIPQPGMMRQKNEDQNGQGSDIQGFTGNGQPVIAGNVTSVSGNTITVGNKNNIVYTVDATNASVKKDGTPTASVGNIKIGDVVIVQGVVNGNSVVANTVIDHGVAPATTSSTDAGAQTPRKNFFQKVGGFFSRMFGF